MSQTIYKYTFTGTFDSGIDSTSLSAPNASCSFTIQIPSTFAPLVGGNPVFNDLFGIAPPFSILCAGRYVCSALGIDITVPMTIDFYTGEQGGIDVIFIYGGYAYLWELVSPGIANMYSGTESNPTLITGTFGFAGGNAYGDTFANFGMGDPFGDTTLTVTSSVLSDTTQIGTNATGQPVFVGDQCTITGLVTLIAGSGSTANITVITDKGDSLIVKPTDLIAETKGGSYTNLDSRLPTVQSVGELFGVNSRVSVRGVVQGYNIGSGSTSYVDVKLANSGGQVVVSTGTLRSVPSQSGNLV